MITVVSQARPVSTRDSLHRLTDDVPVEAKWSQPPSRRIVQAVAGSSAGSRKGSGVVSEYQCYEFVALDRPLTVAELRSISTRAQITPTRFFNEYQWGDLKADPAELLARYFDMHVYFRQLSLVVGWRPGSGGKVGRA